MRAYIVYCAGKTPGHRSIAQISIPVKGRTAVYTQIFDTPTKTVWEDRSKWSIRTPPTDPDNKVDLGYTLKSVLTAGGVPMREWSVEVPDSVYNDPYKKFDAQSAQAPVNQFFEKLIREVDGTDPNIGTRVPVLTPEGYRDHLSSRATQTLNDALGAIQLHTKATGPSARKKKVEPMKGASTYTRPNGEKYYARQWGDHTDIEVLKKARDIFQPVLLLSPPGTGKTAAMEAAYGEALHTVVGSAQTTAADLIGQYGKLPNGDIVWYDGPAVIAAEKGEVLFLDEVGLIDPKELSSIYSLMDGRGTLDIQANPGRATVTAKKGFFIVAATNPNAPGVRLSEALLSRFTVQAVMTTDYNLLEKVIGVDASICRVSANLATMQEEGEVSWAPQFRELLAYHDIQKHFGHRFALANLLSAVPEHDLETVMQVMNAGLGERSDPAKIL